MHISRTGSVGTGATLDAKEMRPRARSEIEARQSRASEMRARCEVAGSYCGELTDECYLNPVLYEAFFFYRGECGILVLPACAIFHTRFLY